ncbi:LAMI_0H03290g1_1 [Lachancea mirantina]|uniref:LAMI_0H03290g1_1 n=1 Tax=Lachancea mirantina TaxID=1230905 RepID=A0A1G4KEE1_9SACH|nr:LAMI_0H03290g1_1 [Lachancea mirantina]
MAFEGMKRIGRQVSKFKIGKRPGNTATEKKKREKTRIPTINPAVATLLEQASSDWSHGETDLAIYRLTRVLSTMDKTRGQNTTFCLDDDERGRSNDGPDGSNIHLTRMEQDEECDIWSLPDKQNVRHLRVTNSDIEEPSGSHFYAYKEGKSSSTDTVTQLADFSHLVDQSFNMTVVNGLESEDFSYCDGHVFRCRSPGIETLWSKGVFEK